MELEKTLKELSDLRSQKKTAIDTSQIMILEIKKDNENLLRVIEEKNNQIELFKKDVQDRDFAIEKLKDKLIESSKLQNKIKLLEGKYATDLSSVKASQFKEVKQRKKEEQVHTKLLALNQFKDEKIQYLQNEIRSFRDRVASEHEVQSETMKI